ncbi:MAG: Sec-independent protein translocase protein TatB [Reyranellales bacterium]
MFGIDSPELLVIAIVALVVIGPKELPGLLRTWGRWLAQMRGMASEFRGHVDEMVRQSELDEVKKQLTVASGLDLKSLDPTQQIRQHVQEGMAEGEKAFNEAKTSFDNPLAEPESAPQIAAEPATETATIETATAETTTAETTTVAEVVPSKAAAPETASSETVPAVSETPQIVEKPAKAAAE